MPQRTGKRGFPTMSDLVKREDEIRRATNRAEARMANNIAHAGGLESAKKHSMAVRNWEQEQVRQDLENMKAASKRSNLFRLQDPEILRYADPELVEDMEELEHLAASSELNEDEELKGYGRHYFGYTSQPGSNKPHFQQMRALKSKYSNVKNYYEYTGPKTMDKATREKLRKQKLFNENVQEKVKSFATPEKPKVAGYQAPESDTNTKPTPEENSDLPQKEDSTEAQIPADKVSESVKPSDADVVSYMSICDQKAASKQNKPVDNSQESPTAFNKQPMSRRTSKSILITPPGSTRNWETGSSSTSHLSLPLYRTAKPKTALDLVFDADTYAPDGRLRTVHTMPDVDKSFKEARQARYIRTKQKREVDRELSVNEMFGR